MFGHFDWHHFISAFVVLFAVIDITGNIPVILTLKKRGKKINALKAALLSLVMFFIFFYVGEAFLNLFNVDISSFAVAGSLIIFIVAMEMILDIEIFHDQPDAPKDATFVPVVFPLIERRLGPGLIYMLQKFFGIILLAISVKLFMTNITPLLASLK